MKLIKKISLISVLAIFGLAFFVSPVQAQEESQKDPCVVTSASWHSVGLIMLSDKSTYNSGETISLEGAVINSNDISVNDGVILAKIFKRNSDSKTMNVAGDYLVKEEVILKNINLGAEQKKEISAKLILPKELKAGDYQASLYFLSEGRLALGGRTTSEKVVGSKTYFKVASETTQEVYFDRTATKINERQYNHVGDNYTYKKGTKIDISQVIKNEFAVEKKAKITYKLYKHNSVVEENLINTKKEDINIPASGEKTLSYTIDSIENADSTLKIEMQTEDGQNAIVNVRIISTANSIRIGNAGIKNFPIKKGEQSEVFACVFSSLAEGKVSKGKVVITIEDEKGNELYKKEKEGFLGSFRMDESFKKLFLKNFPENKSNSIGSVKEYYQASGSYNWLKLKVLIYNENNEKVDEYETIYDCQKIDSTKCLAEESIQEKAGDIKGIISWVVGILLAISIIIIVIMKIKKKKDDNQSGGPVTGGTISMLFLLIFTSILIFSSSTAQAALSECSSFSGSNPADLSQDAINIPYYDIVDEKNCCGYGADCGGSVCWQGGCWLKETVDYNVLNPVPSADKFPGWVQVNSSEQGLAFCSGSVTATNLIGFKDGKSEFAIGETVQFVYEQEANYDTEAYGGGEGVGNGCLLLGLNPPPPSCSDYFNSLDSFYENEDNDFLDAPDIPDHCFDTNCYCMYAEWSFNPQNSYERRKMCQFLEWFAPGYDSSKHPMCVGIAWSYPICPELNVPESVDGQWNKGDFYATSVVDIFGLTPLANSPWSEDLFFSNANIPDESEYLSGSQLERFGIIIDDEKDNLWTKVQGKINERFPSTTLPEPKAYSSDETIIDCGTALNVLNGCVAKSNGTATITIEIPSKPVAPVVGTLYIDEDVSKLGGVGSSVTSGFHQFGPRSVSFNVSVGGAVTPPPSGSCNNAVATTYDSDDVDFNPGNFCSVGTEPVPAPTFPTPGNPSKWTCDGTTCIACKKLDCSVIDYCKGQKISNGCGETCPDADASLHCDNPGDTGYDTRCCGGKWTEVKPE